MTRQNDEGPQERAGGADAESNAFLDAVPDTRAASRWSATVVQLMMQAADAINRVSFRTATRAFAHACSDGRTITLLLSRRGGMLVNAIVPDSSVRLFNVVVEGEHAALVDGAVVSDEDALRERLRAILQSDRVRATIINFALTASGGS